MTKITIDLELAVVRGEFEIRCVEDAGRVVAGIKAASRVLLPTIVFEGEPGFDDDEPVAVNGGPSKTSGHFAEMPRQKSGGQMSSLVRNAFSIFRRRPSPARSMRAFWRRSASTAQPTRSPSPIIAIC
jgi:hypothetical protein